MSALLLADWWVFRIIGSGLLIFVGVAIVVASILRNNRQADPPATPPPADTLVSEGTA